MHIVRIEHSVPSFERSYASSGGADVMYDPTARIVEVVESGQY
jgi:hypothetical protein